MHGRGRGSQGSGQALLRSAIAQRLGDRVEVAGVVPGNNGLVLVLVHLPDLPVGELLRLKGWLQKELLALSAEQPYGTIIVPAYD